MYWIYLCWRRKSSWITGQIFFEFQENSATGRLIRDNSLTGR